MKQLVLATHNPHKVEELSAMLSGMGMTIMSLKDFPEVGELVEDGETLTENALKKAREVHSVVKLPVLADDSGLEVGYLNGRPGVFSARFAGSGATYEENVKKLLAELKGVPARRRGARFRCVLAFVAGSKVKTSEGILPGVIIEEPRGSGGFGYDPVFLPRGFRLTLAEIDADQKNHISHRAKATEEMKLILNNYFVSPGHQRGV